MVVPFFLGFDSRDMNLTVYDEFFFFFSLLSIPNIVMFSDKGEVTLGFVKDVRKTERNRERLRGIATEVWRRGEIGRGGCVHRQPERMGRFFYFR